MRRYLTWDIVKIVIGAIIPPLVFLFFLIAFSWACGISGPSMDSQQSICDELEFLDTVMSYWIFLPTVFLAAVGGYVAKRSFLVFIVGVVILSLLLYLAPRV
jgi:hypothetical protein